MNVEPFETLLAKVEEMERDVNRQLEILSDEVIARKKADALQIFENRVTLLDKIRERILKDERSVARTGLEKEDQQVVKNASLLAGGKWLMNKLRQGPDETLTKVQKTIENTAEELRLEDNFPWGNVKVVIKSDGVGGWMVNVSKHKRKGESLKPGDGYKFVGIDEFRALTAKIRQGDEDVIDALLSEYYDLPEEQLAVIEDPEAASSEDFDFLEVKQY